MSLTLKAAQHALRETGIAIRHRDGEWRVNFRPGGESTAYYTSDLEDAVMTGMAMAHARTMKLIEDLNARRHRWALQKRGG
jgi:hypothetical protein